MAHKRLGRPGDRVEVRGMTCEVVSDAEAEKADVVVCRPAAPFLLFWDNETGPCADCGVRLQWRPHSPKKPIKLCMECAFIRIEAQ